MIILNKKLTIDEIKKNNDFPDGFVKGVVDIEKDLVALDSEMHYELADYLKGQANSKESNRGNMQMDTILKDSWFKLSLVEQMVNIGNEVKRAIRFDSDKAKKDSFLNKAINYTELTMLDPKIKKFFLNWKLVKKF